MKCCVSVFTVFVAVKSVYSSITSNLSLGSKPELDSGECLTRNVEVALNNLENCSPNLGINLFDSFIMNAATGDPSSGPLSFEQMISLKLREHSCAKASEYIHEHNCKAFSKGNLSNAKGDSERHCKENCDTPGDRARDDGLATTAIYLYGWLAYRLIFVFLQQI